MMKRYKALTLFFSLSIFTIFLDQFSKYITQDIISTDIIKGFFSITYTKNTGAAFGLFQGQHLLLTIISLTICIMIIYLSMSGNIPYKIIPQTASALIFGGAIGNLIDRIMLGYVRDFLSVWIWPNFNIADIAITLGAITLMIYIIKKEKT